MAGKTIWQLNGENKILKGTNESYLSISAKTKISSALEKVKIYRKNNRRGKLSVN